MNKNTIKTRLMCDDDFGDVVRIDETILRNPRPEYYKLRFEKLFQTGEYLPTSLVAEDQNQNVVGFIIGELYIGEYGISNEGATIDTVGVDRDFRRKGVGKLLMDEFINHLKELGVKKINTLVEKSDSQLLDYFDANQFSPSKNVINLERSI